MLLLSPGAEPGFQAMPRLLSVLSLTALPAAVPWPLILTRTCTYILLLFLETFQHHYYIFYSALTST